MQPEADEGPDIESLRRRLAALLAEGDLVACNGRLLYSWLGTVRPGPVYFLGYNPGGNPDGRPGTILQELDRSAAVPAGWSAFLDERWSGGGRAGTEGPARTKPLQDRFRALMGALGLDPRAVPASNVILVRSQNAAEIRAREHELARRCWPVHDAILRSVRPRVVLVHGLRAYTLLLGRGRTLGAEDAFPCGYPQFGCCRAVRAVLADRPVGVLALPHLSRYPVDRPNATEALLWLRQRVEGSWQ
jgi:hypothetical protein